LPQVYCHSNELGNVTMLLERAFHATGAIAALTPILLANEAEREPAAEGQTIDFDLSSGLLIAIKVIADELHTELCLHATKKQ
jgi:hypothetical protein